MNLRSLLLRGSACSLLLLGACGDAPETTSAPEIPEAGSTDAAAAESAPADAPIVIEAAQERPLTEAEQNQVIDGVLQARAKQQAEGLGTGRVKVNGAWPYTGYSTISPDPAAAIEARLVAVDVTISGHTPFFDIDDIEIVDGASLMSYGSDPHAEPLRPDGTLLPIAEPVPVAPAASRWLLIYAFPKATPRFQLYYWGKALTPEPVGFGDKGISLPYPAAE